MNEKLLAESREKKTLKMDTEKRLATMGTGQTFLETVMKVHTTFAL